MTTVSDTNVAELFLLDLAFVDRIKTTNGIVSPGTSKICSLTPHGASYITKGLYLVDQRVAGTRAVSWTPVTRSTLLMDSAVFSDVNTALSTISIDVQDTLFALVDRLVFNYNATDTTAVIDAALTKISGGSNLYVAGSVILSTVAIATNVYNDDETTTQVTVPSFATIDVNLMTGSQTQVYQLKIYLSNDSWVTSYSKSTVISVIPPLDYATLYTAPIATSSANVFSTATISSTLSYNTTHDPMTAQTLSGVTTFLVKLVDTTGTTNVPFNLFYKGRVPTVAEMRVAVRTAMLASGTGDYNGWKARAPNVFITSRFYLFPMWGSAIQGSTKTLYPDIIEIADIQTFITQATLSLSIPDDILKYQVFEASYNRMMIISVADSTSTTADGTTPLLRLLTLFPDYQTCSSIDPDYALLSTDTQDFIKQLNYALAQASGVTQTNPYVEAIDGNLKYYPLVVNETELCLVTKDGFTAIEGFTS